MVTMAVSVAVCEIFSVKACDLGNWGRLRSLKMAPFDRPYATFYWSTINNNNNNNQYIYKQRQSHAMSQRRWLATAVIFRPSDMSLGFAET